MTTDYRNILKGHIDRFLRAKYTYEQFAEQYLRVFIDEMPDEALSSYELELYGDVQEKAEWTTAEVDEEACAYGWMNIEEFRSWLSEQRTKL